MFIIITAGDAEGASGWLSSDFECKRRVDMIASPSSSYKSRSGCSRCVVMLIIMIAGDAEDASG